MSTKLFFRAKANVLKVDQYPYPKEIAKSATQTHNVTEKLVPSGLAISSALAH